MLTQTYNIDMIPSGVPLALHISQYDVGLTTFVFAPYVSVGTMDFSVVTEAYLEATKPDMRAIVHACTVGNGTITYTVQEQLAAVSGRVYSKLVLKDASGDVVASKAIVWIVEKAGVTDDAVLSDSDLSGVSQVIQASTNFNDAVPTQTVSGEVLTFDDAVEGTPLEDLTLHLVPKQNLNGYDHPWVGGAGKNKIDLDAFTAGGIGNDGLPDSTSGRIVHTSPIAVDDSQSYTISAQYSESAYDLRIIYAVWNDDTLVRRVANVSIKNTAATLNVSDGNKLYVCLYCDQSHPVVKNYVSELQLEIGTAKTTYAPYSNICPISGYDAVNVVRCGKNLLDTSFCVDRTLNGITTTVQSDGSIKFSGTATSTSRYWFAGEQDIVTLKAGTYTLSGNYMRLATSSGTVLRDTFTLTEDTSITRAYFLITNGTTYNETIYPQLESGSTATSYEAPQATTYPISLSSAGTVYGGTLDVVSGELVVDRAVYTSDGTEAWTKASTSNTYYYNNSQRKRALNTILASSHLQIMSNVSTYQNTEWTCFSGEANNSAIYMHLSNDITTVDSAKEYLAAQHSAGTPLQWYYLLETPITYHLTPTEVTTLLGENTIWMDAEGTIDASYKARLSSYFMALRTMLAPVEASYTATANYAVGDYLIVGTVLYKVTAAITSGETIAEGSNVTATTVMAEIKALQ